MCEAALADAANDDVGERGHMDAAEAGREATRAGVARLLLAHVPAEIGAERVLEMARAEYDGPDRDRPAAVHDRALAGLRGLAPHGARPRFRFTLTA